MALTAKTRRKHFGNRSPDAANASPLQSTFMKALHKAACLDAW